MLSLKTIIFLVVVVVGIVECGRRKIDTQGSKSKSVEDFLEKDGHDDLVLGDDDGITGQDEDFFADEDEDALEERQIPCRRICRRRCVRINMFLPVQCRNVCQQRCIANPALGAAALAGAGVFDENQNVTTSNQTVLVIKTSNQTVSGASTTESTTTEVTSTTKLPKSTVLQTEATTTESSVTTTRKPKKPRLSLEREDKVAKRLEELLNKRFGTERLEIVEQENNANDDE